MKIFKFYLPLAFAFLAFMGCNDDDEGPTLLNVESETFVNLHAPQIGGVDTSTGQSEPISGEFTKFNFATGQTTSSDTDWDIAFRATTIIVNGGQSQGSTDEPERNGNAAAYVVESTFADISEVDTSLLNQDSQQELAITPLSGQGWYSYTGPPNPNVPNSNLILPLAGRVLVFRTRDGRYAKVEILSYYRNNPSNEVILGFTDEQKISEARYYTFNYVYQPNEGLTTF